LDFTEGEDIFEEQAKLGLLQVPRTLGACLALKEASIIIA
jgi:hypothetical protein